MLGLRLWLLSATAKHTGLLRCSLCPPRRPAGGHGELACPECQPPATSLTNFSGQRKSCDPTPAGRSPLRILSLQSSWGTHLFPVRLHKTTAHSTQRACPLMLV